MPAGTSPQIDQFRLLFLAVLTAMGGLATGLYLPAFPEMEIEYETDAAGAHLHSRGSTSSSSESIPRADETNP